MRQATTSLSCCRRRGKPSSAPGCAATRCGVMQACTVCRPGQTDVQANVSPQQEKDAVRKCHTKRWGEGTQRHIPMKPHHSPIYGHTASYSTVSRNIPKRFTAPYFLFFAISASRGAN